MFPLSNNTNSFMNDVFGPLPKFYCLYYYILSIVGFISFVLFILYFLYTIIAHSKKLDLPFYIMGISFSITYLLIYFTNRLLFSMCSNSLH